MSEAGPPAVREAESVEEFVWLVGEWRDAAGEDLGACEAVCVERRTRLRPSAYGASLVRRYMVATFACGQGTVCYSRTSSNAVELPEMAERLAERHAVAAGELRARIRAELLDIGLDVPVRETTARTL